MDRATTEPIAPSPSASSAASVISSAVAPPLTRTRNVKTVIPRRYRESYCQILNTTALFSLNGPLMTVAYCHRSCISAANSLTRACCFVLKRSSVH